MLSSIFRREKGAEHRHVWSHGLRGLGGQHVDEPSTEERVSRLLVIQSDKYDWSTMFHSSKLSDGTSIHVEQVGWDDFEVAADTAGSCACLVHIRPRQANATLNIKASSGSTFIPDFMLIRNEVRTAQDDHRNKLYGLMYGGLNERSVNSLSSIYNFCERPIVHAELIRIQHELGPDTFPVVQQSYFSSHRCMMYGNSFPAVAKVGHAHAGMGKMLVADHHVMEDFRSVLAMTGNPGAYCTAEPFLDGMHDLRIQKIGRRVRTFKRIGMSGSWKTNTGCAVIEEIPTTDRYRVWAETASKMFGGLDICTVDVLVSDDGKESILEVNGTSSGLMLEREEEDNEDIRDLVIEKMNKLMNT